ncbi:hypothetical protein KL930_000454 [Ogataea haglerorum]|nr:hypothetical protein KL915_000124 [Ogataea haglerorum]KAG7706001.1 hypothetical protein KL950_003577 [Ogataea haglerorum]KAG7741390.1 hypothetical protein KL932_002677 [Ogataea haglerorum]KAG7777555.1 hypothetical protein KL922_002945 [Ogataea haglerorum]KAG7783120.1 hypothetical protein KL930_000454 [Ogataea haglerorum]
MVRVRTLHTSRCSLNSSKMQLHTKFTLRRKSAQKEEVSTDSKTPARTRFAPSPTGFLHLGSLRTALYNYLLARATGGQFLLRLEDTDQKRLVTGAEENIYDTLNWLGIKIDEGPTVGGAYGPYRQSDRSEIYTRYINELLDKGLAYRCFCSKSRLDGLRDSAKLLKPPTTVSYDRHCLKVYTKEESAAKAAQGEEFTVRFLSPDKYQEFNDLLHGNVNWQPQVNPFDKRFEDPVLLKSDGLPTYHFANVVDDHLMKITHVIRGEEWLASTPKHIALYEAFEWRKPKFVHIPLLTTVDNKKLSKRTGDIDIMSLKRQGYLPEALINFAVLFGWAPKRAQGEKSNEIYSMDFLEKHFNLDGLTVGNAKVDFQKLNYFNKHYLQQKLQDPEFLDRASADIYAKLNQDRGITQEYVKKVLVKTGSSLTTLDSVFDESFKFYFERPTYTRKGLENVLKPGEYGFVKLLAEQTDFTDLKALIPRIMAVYPDITKKNIYQTIRYAISAGQPGTKLPDMIELLGNEEVIARLNSLKEIL